MVAIPDDDVADAHRDADAPGPLDLRAADFDGIAVADIFLDRRGQPGRRHLQVDRAGAEPPPQPAEADYEDDHQRRQHDGQALYPALPGQPSAEAAEAIAESVKAGIRPRQQPTRLAARRLVVVLIPIGII